MGIGKACWSHGSWGPTHLRFYGGFRMTVFICGARAQHSTLRATGADHGQEPTPKGGGDPPSTDPKMVVQNNGLVGARGAGDFVLGIRQGEIFLFDPMCLF